MHDPIDFVGLNEALLRDAERHLENWLPGGRVQGNEYVCAGLGGGKGGSFSVNLTTGKWGEFNGTETGRDMVSLYAAIEGLGNVDAARQLMKDLGWEKGQTATPPPRPSGGAVRTSGNAPTRQQVEGVRTEKRRSMWRAIVPVPDNAPAPTFEHYERGLAPMKWEYRYNDVLYGYVCRFETSDGGKEIIPYTWCVDESDTRGTRRWSWKQWEEPRPLFVPATLLAGDPALVPVVVVEGEKCAVAGLELLGHEFDFVSWPGGGKACLKADWSWLKGRVVYLWPDCDAKRVALTKDERAAGLDQGTKPLLPEFKQPGVRTMRQIGELLVGEHGCQVLWVPIPEPGQVGDGWDIADAIASGWAADQVRDYIRKARPFQATDEARAKKAAASTPPSAGAGDEERDSSAWRSGLITSSTGAIKTVRENVVLALSELPEVKGTIGFNQFTNDIAKIGTVPWDSPATKWEEEDELLMGEWLVREHYMPSMPRSTLEEAVRMIAFRHRFHPVRAYLEGLVWDEEPRLKHWLRRVCLDDDYPRSPELDKYLARAGTWFLQGMCARIVEPGVKFDYMLILEGDQGRRKSAVFKALAGDYFADTGLQMGEKDSYQMLQGRWLYEFAELDSFAKSEVTKIKAFVASASDYFRASFDKRARDYPRQVVFGGTTNEDTYFTDPTGNRRFWSVPTSRVCDIEWLLANRDQLFAEAMERIREGQRMHPTPEEEAELFRPQQDQRTVDNSIYDAIARFLQSPEGATVSECSCVEILGKIGIGIEKLGPGRHHEKQAGAAMKRLGWKRERSSKTVAGIRPWVYRKPSTGASAPSPTYTPPAQGTTFDQEEAEDSIPF